MTTIEHKWNAPVLNQDLYRRLLVLFGPHGVKIANFGEIAKWQPVYDVFNNSWDYSLFFWGETYHVCCYGCSDKRYRLYINYQFGTPHPFTGEILTGLVKCFNTECQKRPGFIANLINRLRQVDVTDPSVLTDLPLPDHSRLVRSADRPITMPFVNAQGNPAIALEEMLRYLCRGNRDPIEIIREYRLEIVSFDESRPYLRGGLFVPVFDPFNSDKLVAWQVRQFVPERHFYSSAGIKQTVYCHPAIFNQKIWVLCEGVSDAWVVGYPGIALFGKHLSVFQLRILMEMSKRNPGLERMVVLLDPDAVEEAKRIIGNLRTYASVSSDLVILPEGLDPSDMDARELWCYIHDQLSTLRGVDHVS